MNTNPHATKILCYGDSNTWGQLPTGVSRYPSNVRWPGIVQQKLGNDYYVIEEGLSGRTTNLEHTKPGRNGKDYLQPCLESHSPLDVVIIMLGTNDLKINYDRSPEDVSIALEELVNIAKSSGASIGAKPPRVILVSPIHMNSSAPGFATYAGKFDQESAEKSLQLTTLIKDTASRTGTVFIDAATVAQPGDDGIHMDASSHLALSQLISDTILLLAPYSSKA